MSKVRSKYVLEGVIEELLKNEYDRYLDIDELQVNIDSQKFLGSVSEYEAEQCMNILNRVKELKDNEITLLQTLSRNIYAYVRPEEEKKEETTSGETPDNTTSNEIEGQVHIDEVAEKASELNTDRAMKGIDTSVKADGADEKK